MLKRLLAWLNSKRSTKIVTKKPTKAAPSISTQPNKVTTSRAKSRAGYSVQSINTDELSTSAKAAFTRSVADQSDLPLFSGKINHAYDLTEIDDAKICPRCSAPTNQQYANWVYATNSTPRAMLAPAGYFCSKCPTVIIDQKLLRQGVSRGYRYVQVIGLTNESGKGFHGFTTWNGEEPIYLFDEAGNPNGFARLTDLSPEEQRQYKAKQAKPKSKRLRVKRNR